MLTVTVLAVLGGVLAGGVLVGAVLRLLLGRLRRGACASVGACEVGVAAAVGVPVATWLLGPADGTWLPVWVGVGVLAVAVTVTDLAHRRIPNVLTGAGLVALPLLAAPLGPGAVLAGLAGAAVVLAVYAAVHLVSPRSLGGGDVKLAGVLAVPLAAGSFPALALAPLLTAVVALAMAAVTRSRTVPLGPPSVAVAWGLVGGLALGAP